MQMIVAGDGNLYGFDDLGMYSINLTDGAATFIQDTPTSDGFFDSATQIVATTTGTPEPDSAILLFAGLVLLGAGRVWRLSVGR